MFWLKNYFTKDLVCRAEAAYQDYEAGAQRFSQEQQLHAILVEDQPLHPIESTESDQTVDSAIASYHKNCCDEVERLANDVDMLEQKLMESSVRNNTQGPTSIELQAKARQLSSEVCFIYTRKIFSFLCVRLLHRI